MSKQIENPNKRKRVIDLEVHESPPRPWTREVTAIHLLRKSHEELKALRHIQAIRHLWAVTDRVCRILGVRTTSAIFDGIVASPLPTTQYDINLRIRTKLAESLSGVQMLQAEKLIARELTLLGNTPKSPIVRWIEDFLENIR